MLSIVACMALCNLETRSLKCCQEVHSGRTCVTREAIKPSMRISLLFRSAAQNLTISGIAEPSNIDLRHQPSPLTAPSAFASLRRFAPRKNGNIRWRSPILNVGIFCESSYGSRSQQYVNNDQFHPHRRHTKLSRRASIPDWKMRLRSVLAGFHGRAAYIDWVL